LRPTYSLSPKIRQFDPTFSRKFDYCRAMMSQSAARRASNVFLPVIRGLGCPTVRDLIKSLTQRTFDCGISSRIID